MHAVNMCAMCSNLLQFKSLTQTVLMHEAVKDGGKIVQQPISDFCVFDHKVCDKNGNILHIRQCTG
jgi:hypothetical protein